MSNIGILSVIGLFVIVIALIAWVVVLIHANRHPAQTTEPGGELKRGPVSGGAIRADPGQNILTGEAPRQDDPAENEPR
jgi:hypothetical protein